MTVNNLFSGSLGVNQLIADSSGLLVSNTRIVAIESQNPDGSGVYIVKPDQTVAPEMMFGVLEYVRGWVNRVPEPREGDFVVMMPMRQTWLSYNITSYADNIVQGSITSNTLTVTTLTQPESLLIPGMVVRTLSSALQPAAPNTLLGAQLTGTTGGIGTYNISPAQDIANGTFYLGTRNTWAPTRLTVQVDVHGPNSGNNATMIGSLLRTEYAVDVMAQTGYDVVPLYSSDPRFVPFYNAEQQVEYRWSLDAELQINPVTLTPQEFFDRLAPVAIPVETLS
jgi:hypothetical protein